MDARITARDKTKLAGEIAVMCQQIEFNVLKKKKRGGGASKFPEGLGEGCH